MRPDFDRQSARPYSGPRTVLPDTCNRDPLSHTQPAIKLMCSNVTWINESIEQRKDTSSKWEIDGTTKYDYLSALLTLLSKQLSGSDNWIMVKRAITNLRTSWTNITVDRVIPWRCERSGQYRLDPNKAKGTCKDSFAIQVRLCSCDYC
jgi:hypothetical protein